MTVLKLRQRGMRLSWKSINPGHRVLELQRYRSSVNLHIWLGLPDQTEYSRRVICGRHMAIHVNLCVRSIRILFGSELGILSWYWLRNYLVYVEWSSRCVPWSWVYLHVTRETKLKSPDRIICLTAMSHLSRYVSALTSPPPSQYDAVISTAIHLCTVTWICSLHETLSPPVG